VDTALEEKTTDINSEWGTKIVNYGFICRVYKKSEVKCKVILNTKSPRKKDKAKDKRFEVLTAKLINVAISQRLEIAFLKKFSSQAILFQL
jgi:hypothetical protein